MNKTFGYLFFLLLTLIVVMFVGLSNNEIADMTSALLTVNPIYIVCCFFCYLLYLLLDATGVHLFLRSQGQKIKFKGSLYSSINGLLYSNITPGATGGQPMQMYALSRYNVPVALSGSAVAIKFFIFECMLLFLGSLLWICNIKTMSVHLKGIELFVVFGYVANFFSIALVLLVMLNGRFVDAGMKWMVRVLTKLHLCKNPEKTIAKWENHLYGFTNSVSLVWKNPKSLILLCVVNVLQIFALMSITYAIACAFSIYEGSFIEIITLSTLLYISAGYTPLPGASGAQEAGFNVFFQGIFIDPSQRFVALLIWRFFTYYITIVLGFIVAVYVQLLDLNKKNRNKKNESV